MIFSVQHYVIVANISIYLSSFKELKCILIFNLVNIFLLLTRHCFLIINFKEGFLKSIHLKLNGYFLLCYDTKRHSLILLNKILKQWQSVKSLSLSLYISNFLWTVLYTSQKFKLLFVFLIKKNKIFKALSH